MTDVEDRIRGFAGAVEQLDVGDIRRRVEVRRRNRRMVAGTACVVLVAGLGSSLVAIALDNDSKGVPSVDSGPTTVSLTESTTATTVTATTTDVVDTAPVETSLDESSGPGGGPYIEPASLPQGWMMTDVSRTDGPLGSSENPDLISDTVLARYTPDRSQIVETIHIQVRVFDDTVQLRRDVDPTGVDIEVHGLPGYQVQTAVEWVEDGFVIDVSRPGTPGTASQIDPQVYREVAEGVALDSGVVTTQIVPVGFEVLAELRGGRQGEGPEHVASYATNDSATAGEVGLWLSVVAHPPTPAEVSLSNSFPPPYAVDNGGRRMIVSASGTQLLATVEIRWDQPDRSQVLLTYGAPIIDRTRDEVVAEALQLASAVRLAGDGQWSEFEDNAVIAAAEVASLEWVDAGLADAGLSATGAPRVEAISTGGYTVLVPAARATGEPAGTCEFLFRSFMGCTAADTTELTPTGDVLITEVGPGVFRAVMTNNIAMFALLHEGRGPSFGGFTNLFDATTSPLVTYLKIDPADGPACLRFTNVNGAELAQRGVDDGVVSSTCDT